MAGQRMAALVLSDEERAELTSLAARRNTAQALALRARIVLRCATGAENQQVAAELRIDKTTVGKLRRRFVERRLDGLRDEPRSGAPRTVDDARIEAVIVRTPESPAAGRNALEYPGSGGPECSQLFDMASAAFAKQRYLV